MLVTQIDRLLHPITSCWIHTKSFTLCISPIFLNFSVLQYVHTMAEMKQESYVDEVIKDKLRSVVVAEIPEEVVGRETLNKKKDLRRSHSGETTLFVSESHIDKKLTLDIGSSNEDSNMLTDATISDGVMPSPDSDSFSEVHVDQGYAHRLSTNLVSETLSVPLHTSSSDHAHDDGSINPHASKSRLAKDDIMSGSCGNDMQNTYPNANHWILRDQVENHIDDVNMKTKLHIHSCPDLHFRQYVQPNEITDDGCRFFSSSDVWSALKPQQSVVLEGIDESKVISLRHRSRICARSSSKCKNISDPCINSIEATSGIIDNNIQSKAEVMEASCTEGKDNNNVCRDTHLIYTPPDSSQTCEILNRNDLLNQSIVEPSEEYWSSYSDRRGSMSSLLLEPDRDSLSSQQKREQYEHIELFSFSPTQRKRKYRRKRSLSLPKRPHTGKNKTGKTNKLCKKKKADIQVHITPVLHHTGHNDIPSSSASGYTMKKVDRRGQTTQDHSRAKNQTYASLICTGIHSSLKECITEDGIRTPLVVLFENDSESSVCSLRVPEHSRTKANDYHSKKCLHIRRRSSVDKVRGVIVPGGEFTVVPVNNDVNLLEQSVVSGGHDNSNSLRVPHQSFDIDGEPTDTLTQNSITSLLSAKFRDVAKRWRQYGVDSPRFRKRLHSKWESMNYEETDSQLQRTYNLEHKSKKQHALDRLSSWVIYFFIGVGTAFMAAGVQISVEIIANLKFSLIRDFLDKCSEEDCLIQPMAIWICLNAGITLLGAALVTYVQPMAAGSGIPLIKSYLNGVRVPGLLSLRAFIAKCLGVVLSILGGLACGKEGPMAHSGGIVAAGLGKGRIPWFNKDINLYGLFRNDHNIRDLVAAGAASGVSAAFGAPVGGTLFSVEEAASFWNTELVWKVFFSAMIACFSTNVLLSAFEGHPTQLSNPGLVRFNTFPNLTFDLIEVPVFIIMAAIGGLIGSLFVGMNYKLTVFRQKYLHRKKWIKVVEAGLVAVVSAIVAFVLMLSVKDCTNSQPYTHHAITTKMGCTGGSHNSLSALFLTTPEGCLKALLHDPIESYSVVSLVLFTVIFFLLGVWTYGLSVSSGVFIPSLAIGAAWGRLIGLAVVQLFPDQAKDIGKYALIGAASQLGGILRTTISLTVIIVECTGDITFGLCIMIALMISKWVGDFFTTGLYDMNIEVSGIPLLSWEPPPLCEHIYVNDFMSQPVMTLQAVEKVGHIYSCLLGETFHGFPVIDQDVSCQLTYKGKLKGLILRHQILVLLKKRIFCPEGQVPTNSVVLSDFENSCSFSQSLKTEDISLSDADKECVMNLSPYMNRTPYTVSLDFSMARVFRLFRGLGLRHLVVVNDGFEPIGMVTRKDLAKYRAEIKKGLLHMEQLTVENR